MWDIFDEGHWVIVCIDLHFAVSLSQVKSIPGQGLELSERIINFQSILPTFGEHHQLVPQ